MAYYHQPNIRSLTNVNADDQHHEPMDRQAFLVDQSDWPYSPEQLQDDDETRGRRQQYTYIPSTSSVSSGDNQQLPQVPFTSPDFLAHASASYTPHPSDHNSYASYQAYPVPSIISFPAETNLYSSSAPGLVLDDASSTKYTSVNPFKSRVRRNSLPIAFEHFKADSVTETPGRVVYPYSHRRKRLLVMLVESLNLAFNFLWECLPRQVYLHLLLRLPTFYWSRVARIFEEAEMTMPEIENVALQAMGSITIEQLHLTGSAGANLKVTWETFIDSLLREWKTLNIVSVLLLSAILTLLQIDAAGSDPIARNCALVSLICALMSLLYGCIYIIRFSSMRKTYKALEWAQV
ncbi:hypothetical protein C0993_000263 [Termitomyces sp. T159_Od127]|nr:hypothetical protein C0993_000263 [Termitomyces sp. T159_Od127]